MKIIKQRLQKIAKFALLMVKEGDLLDGRWKVGGRVGSGGFGNVYNTTHVRHGTEAIVKISHRPKWNFQFETEANILRRLAKRNEPGFPKVHDHVYIDNCRALIMQKVGEPLCDDFRNQGDAYTMPMVVKIGTALLSRLYQLHKIGYIHRDIRPDNVLFGPVSDRRKVYLVDFGISQRYLDRNDKNHISPGTDPEPVGDVYFAALAFHQGRIHSRKDDMESLMYLIAFLFRGTLPWLGEETRDAIMKKKSRFTSSKLYKTMPKGYREMWERICSMGFTEKPPYVWLKEKLVKIRSSKRLAAK